MNFVQLSGCSSCCFLTVSTLMLLFLGVFCGLLRLRGFTLSAAGVEVWVSICSMCFNLPCDVCPHMRQS